MGTITIGALDIGALLIGGIIGKNVNITGKSTAEPPVFTEEEKTIIKAKAAALNALVQQLAAAL